MPFKNNYKIAIITPSYNQASYIDQTIRSVQAQDYSNVEHIIVDGGSSDGTLEILSRYPHLIWISESDRGQADALNKGLALAKADIVGWINSDDYYEKNIFRTVVESFSDPSTMWIVGNLSYVDKDGVKNIASKSPRITYERLLTDPDIVQQPPTFFRRIILEQVGGWNAEFFMVMDLDLWVRLAKISPPRMVAQNLAYFRLHSQQKSSFSNLQRQTREICKILKREGVPRNIVARLFFKKQWQAFKWCCREVLVFFSILDGGQNRELAKHARR